MSAEDRINNIRSTPTSDITAVIDRWLKYKSAVDSSTLYKYLSPTVDSAIVSYTNGDKKYRVPAYRIAFDAISTFDPSKGVDVKTHVYHNLKRLNRIHADRSNVVHIPEGVAKDRTILSKAISSFYDEYNREPNDDELSDLTKLSKRRIDKVLNRTTPISGSEAVTEEGADRVANKGISNDTYIDYLHASSDNIDKKIIELMSGYRGRKVISGAEAARKIGITPAAVSLRMNGLRQKMSELKELL